jgi:hypothetical protein
MCFHEIKNHLYQNLPSPRERRRILIDEMTGLSDKTIHCFNCNGTCCTFSANSMQITPIEAFEILISLNEASTNLSELKVKLQENIQNYRLDHEIFLGRKKNFLLRKTYTCPFFMAGPKGCTIKKEFKPYGCLGFNPRIEDDNGSQCLSNVVLLEQREKAELQNEQKANDFLKHQLQLDWDKLEIPKAILKLLEKMPSLMLGTL